MLTKLTRVGVAIHSGTGGKTLVLLKDWSLPLNVTSDFSLNTKWLQKALPHPTAKPWDFVFSQRKPYWVIITLKDGAQIAGRYDVNSFASSAPAQEQLYLEEAWVLSSGDGFERPRVDSAGILILAPDIATVEFFYITRGDKDGGQTEVTH